MAHTKQALKRARQSKVRRASHKSERAALKTQFKNLDDVFKSGDAKKIDAAIRDAQAQIDKAAQHKVMHRNAASRTKSRLAARARKALAPKPAK